MDTLPLAALPLNDERRQQLEHLCQLTGDTPLEVLERAIGLYYRATLSLDPDSPELRLHFEDLDASLAALREGARRARALAREVERLTERASDLEEQTACDGPDLASIPLPTHKPGGT
ncbi:hypothetical protein HNR42_003284 [Deinobacterium chartae]|uniref:Uncharacterized protein n=1 Tax=Deinobacterium chartae TaxID=521158 RepID=A0A841I467_9DEIO|nr:hypothetical protein [Deinobacterium chartae]MBB6099826.1 hypothetical protein [Deinobacterium chartae]